MAFVLEFEGKARQAMDLLISGGFALADVQLDFDVWAYILLAKIGPSQAMITVDEGCLVE
jgi:hypothetical protein